MMKHIALLFVMLATLACGIQAALPVASSTENPPTAQPAFEKPIFQPQKTILTPTPACFTVSAVEAVNLRITPDTNYPPIATLLHGSHVTDLQARSAAWYFVQSGTVSGWVNSGYLKEGCE